MASCQSLTACGTAQSKIDFILRRRRVVSSASFAGHPHVRLVMKCFAGVCDAEGKVDALQGLPIPSAQAPVLVRTAHPEAPYENPHQSTV